MKRAGIAAAIGFIAAIVAANYVTTAYGMIPVGPFGLTATAGTFFAGAVFVLRDAVQDAAGKRAVLALIVLGIGLSYIVSDPFIALASAVAFGLGEFVNTAIYTPLRSKGYVRAAIASNVVAAVVDTFLFLWIAGFPIAGAWQGQMFAKLVVTAAAVIAVLSYRARSKGSA